jgi:hypothetical protein
VVIPVKPGYVGTFSEGLAPIITSNKFGFIDKNGWQVIAPQFDWTGGFSEGLAVVRAGGARGGKYGYIDRAGRLVIPLQFDNAQSFEGGLARVWTAGRQGYIDKTGAYVWKPSK